MSAAGADRRPVPAQAAADEAQSVAVRSQLAARLDRTTAAAAALRTWLEGATAKLAAEAPAKPAENPARKPGALGGALARAAQRWGVVGTPEPAAEVAALEARNSPTR